ncbi:hypothetical protein P3W85_19975 [Cupriavidus basilensis]|uniref:Uncharacterized protein n=1 Tax=Cupriavidus basilensis TaxID=68895 RepID=A0ABT6ARH4_9BURK|nr:hypothetical protein [Cupriavidus basilensis]MDF3835222.1 hypothetical protein [Cupriavidus basilensis]
MATGSNRKARTAAPVAANGEAGAPATTVVKTTKPAKAAKAERARKPEAADKAGGPAVKSKASSGATKGAAAKPGKAPRENGADNGGQGGGKKKVVRDSFTMPEWDYRKLAELKRRCLDGGAHVKKSELLRAGLKLLEALPEKKLLAAVGGVETVKTGRPSKRKAREASPAQ